MPRTDDKQELALLRLVAQRLAGPRRPSPEGVVRHLLCLQAQDYWSGIASVAARAETGLAEVESALDADTVARAWPLRGTLHLVCADDLGWLRALLAPRELQRAAGREAALGIDALLLERAERVAVELLSTRGPSSRAQITAAWSAHGIETSGQRGYHLIWHLAHIGALWFGPVRDGQQMLVAPDQSIHASAGLAREEALALLARRYFDSHGPATAADLSRWANLTAADTRQAIATAGDELATATLGPVQYLLGAATRDELADCRREARGVLALPGFDEILLGYRDRAPTLPPERRARVFPNRNGIPACIIILAGQVVATWKRPAAKARATIEIAPLAPISERNMRLARTKAAALK